MNTGVRLDNGTSVKVTERVFVNVDPQRDLHGPCVVRAANGDLLLCHQDSNAHHGGEGLVHQWRSCDGGFNWDDEGPAADWRDGAWSRLGNALYQSTNGGRSWERLSVDFSE